ncbi:hypothetical protein [Stakelama tenebrarum]|uniref:Uncharacterized protein n=1 Tax=Stakelama tenebrarum TaxID=2711215 RepID=A0A6G6Y5A3_9SPHN|nr:hypothetical protein [Sphingosinithalassobacter tenebrarum]QIG80112.1 hypothetical protein G5C33_10190 [Sphingosinithalassobacter tenebrarum]
MQLTSEKTPDALEQCIALSLSAYGHPTVINGPDRRDIMVGGFAVSILYGEPNRIEVRKMLMMHKPARDHIRDCV